MYFPCIVRMFEWLNIIKPDIHDKCQCHMIDAKENASLELYVHGDDSPNDTHLALIMLNPLKESLQAIYQIPYSHRVHMAEDIMMSHNFVVFEQRQLELCTLTTRLSEFSRKCDQYVDLLQRILEEARECEKNNRSAIAS